MSRWSRYESYYPEYVPVAERRRKAQQKIKALGGKLSPVVIEGRTITKTFWGNAWCKNVESYHDYENRLPRGRSYVRNGSVIDLQIGKGKITAQVMGTSLYKIAISISELPKEKWERIKKECAGKIASLIDLIQGKLSSEIISLLCRKDEGLFPSPKEIKMDCSCPDWASLCKHLAAVLYGVGARLDEKPELFFLLRGVDQNELFSADFTKELTTADTVSDIADSSLGDVFGIELDSLEDEKKAPAKKKVKIPAKEKSKLPVKKKTEKPKKVKTKSSAKKKKSSAKGTKKTSKKTLK